MRVYSEGRKCEDGVEGEARDRFFKANTSRPCVEGKGRAVRGREGV